MGAILRQEREKRGLSLEEVHEATKITVQNLSAIEDDRFDHFPNRVYARAFLRDYANFLGLDSGSLLARYEEEWNGAGEPAPAPTAGRSAWRAVGFALMGLIVIGGLCAAAYFFGFTRCGEERLRPKVREHVPAEPGREVATLPVVGPVAPPGPEHSPKPAPAPKPTPRPVPPEKLTLRVAALMDVWVRITADKQVIFIGTIRKGDAKTFDAKKRIRIRAGMAGAVQLKLNDQLQPSLGTMKQIGDKEFTLPNASLAVPNASAAPPDVNTH